MNSVTLLPVDSALGCFRFPPGLGETFIPSSCWPSPGIRKAADGSGLQFFISFRQPVQCSTWAPPFKTPEFLLGSDCWEPNGVMSPKAGVQGKSRQTQPPREAPVGAHLISPGSGFSWEERPWEGVCSQGLALKSPDRALMSH